MVYGARLGYHITEDFFVEAAYGQTKVSDENFRAILPGGVFPQVEQTLRYYNLSAGYNILPGEVFFGGRLAKASALYLIAGVGSTKFLEQNKQTVNFGLGLRIFLKDWAAIQVDFRDHVYPLDLLGRRKDTQNLELSTGVTFFF
jgi:outer membrane beta-barrel protein